VALLAQLSGTAKFDEARIRAVVDNEATEMSRESTAGSRPSADCERSI
jgi:hypothetical protein